MESQLTLVNPTILDANEPAEVFILHPNNAKNTQIIGRGSEEILYTVKTDLAVTNTVVTTPRDGDYPLANIQRREFLSDKNPINGGETIKTKSWLKYGGVLIIKFPASFTENGKEYFWRSSMMFQLSLYLPASDPETPIAWFERSKRRVENGSIVLHQPYLAMQPEALEIQDIVVLSFLVLELKNRMAQKADGLASGRLSSSTAS